MSTNANRNAGADLPDEERAAGQLRLSRADFEQLPLAKIEELSGLPLPASRDTAAIEKYRLQAWQSFLIDVTHRDEWGTARQGIPLPD